MIWVGVDPGPRWTGIAAREATRLVAWRVVDLHDVEPGATRPGYPALDLIAATVQEIGGRGFRVGVEDTVPPVSHIDGKLSIINVEDLLRAAEIVGYVERAFPGTVRVRPSGNGHQALASYPEPLVTPTERANAIRKRRLLEPAPQNTVLRHARSAWDVAGVAAKEDRIARSRAAAAVARVAAVRAAHH